MSSSRWDRTSDNFSMWRMLDGYATDRKLELFCCACCDRLLADLPEAAFHHAIQCLEAFADDLNEMSALFDAHERAKIVHQRVRPNVMTVEPGDVISDAANPHSVHDLHYARRVGGRTGVITDDRRLQIRLLRDIFGNPFRPIAINPAWLTWRDGTVGKLAQTIYDDRRFDLLPILADALQEASCTNGEILQHCHAPGPHVRGCWVVDLLLGKE
ncbi:MAG TPA: hypothetical protein VKS79_12685 [Gemmataceae bacterium]|nr:hypothetical protein [Gemmataceae bacterium]